MALLSLLLCPGISLNAADSASARAPIPVMILDGESNPYHDWQAATPMLQRMLEETGLFSVDVVTAPPADGDFGGFNPAFSDYATVILNYDAPDDRWPPSLQQRFADYVRDGGGLVIVHAANNAFPGWTAFNDMTGVGGWRGRDGSAGPYWFIDAQGALARDHGAGPAGSHGRRVPFEIMVRTDHPITRGLPPRWLHVEDELYARLRGPGTNMTVLASAWSDPANQGSGRHEPQLMVISHGAGRVFHTTLGHDPRALAAVDFVTTFQRGVEWSATGAVTQALPGNFPTESAVSLREDLLAIGTAYREHRQP